MFDGILSVSEASELFIDGKAVAILYLNGQEIWPLGPAKRDGLGLRALQDGSSVEFLKGAGAPDNYFLSSFDRRYWGEWDGSPVDVPKGKTLWVGALSSNTRMSNHAAELSGGWTFSLSGAFSAQGRAQALLDQNYSLSTCPEYAFTGVFRRCTALKDASQLELPQVKSGGYACFNRMFAGSGISAAPSLSGAEFVPQYGMQYMFYDCDSLLSAPALPALSVSNSGCHCMYQSCGGLRSAGALSATKVEYQGFSNMFDGCGSLSSPPPSLEVTGTLNQSYCFYRMFRSCTSLLSTPDMKFTSTYNIGAAADMFNSCTRLSCVRTALTSWGTRTGNWLDNVASAGVFICPSTLGTQDTIQRGPSYCPANWRVVNSDGIDYVPYVNVYGSRLDTGFVPTATMSFRTVISTGLESTDSAVVGNGANSPDTARLFYSGGWGWMFDLGQYTNRARANISQPNPGVFDISCWNLGIDLSASGGTTARDAHGPTTTDVVFPQATLSVNTMNTSFSRNFNISCLQIYDGGTLARDFRAVRDPNGTACMWDEVSQQYFYPGAQWTVVDPEAG